MISKKEIFLRLCDVEDRLEMLEDEFTELETLIRKENEDEAKK